MRLSKSEIPKKIDAPGAVARQMPGFGNAADCDKMAGEYFSLQAGTDLTPLLKGLEHDLCQSPHWGYLIDGDLTVTYQDGSNESVRTGDLFYWPPGHTLEAQEDVEMVLFSPEKPHCAVVDHVRDQLAG